MYSFYVCKLPQYENYDDGVCTVQYCVQICQNWRVELYNYHYAWTVIRFISQNKAV